MPRMDGPAATRAIRALEASWAASDASAPPRAPLRIVAVTANSSQEDRHDCIASGMDEFLVKPVTPALMRAALARLAPLTA